MTSWSCLLTPLTMLRIPGEWMINCMAAVLIDRLWTQMIWGGEGNEARVVLCMKCKMKDFWRLLNTLMSGPKSVYSSLPVTGANRASIFDGGMTSVFLFACYGPIFVYLSNHVKHKYTTAICLCSSRPFWLWCSPLIFQRSLLGSAACTHLSYPLHSLGMLVLWTAAYRIATEPWLFPIEKRVVFGSRAQISHEICRHLGVAPYWICLQQGHWALEVVNDWKRSTTTSLKPLLPL